MPCLNLLCPDSAAISPESAGTGRTTLPVVLAQCLLPIPDLLLYFQLVLGYPPRVLWHDIMGSVRSAADWHDVRERRAFCVLTNVSYVLRIQQCCCTLVTAVQLGRFPSLLKVLHCRASSDNA